MLIFLAIMAAGLIVVVGGALFGHDHDHDASHDHGGDAGHDNEPTVSVFSPKVIGTFVMGFGGGGALAQHIWGDVVRSSFVGLATGLLMALLMYGAMKWLYGQQATSLVSTGSLIGKTATVTTAIGADSIGQVVVHAGIENPTYLARSSSGKDIARGKAVRVVAANGSEVVVDDVQS